MNKPATPLPWFTMDEIIYPALDNPGDDFSAYEQAWIADCRTGQGKKNAQYIIAAANAYPRLIAALREVYQIAEGPGETNRPQWARVRALLRELGE